MIKYKYLIYRNGYLDAIYYPHDDDESEIHAILDVQKSLGRTWVKVVDEE